MNITQKVFLDLGGDAWESCKGEMFVRVFCASVIVTSQVREINFRVPGNGLVGEQDCSKGLILDEFVVGSSRVSV